MTDKETQLKNAVAQVLDAFDDAVLNAPGASEADRTALLVNHLLPSIIERAEKYKSSDPNPDLGARAKAELMTLMQLIMQCSEGISAVVVLRLFDDGHVRASGGSKNLRDGAVEEMAEICRLALSELARVKMTNPNCQCPSCLAKRGVTTFGGPKAQA